MSYASLHLIRRAAVIVLMGIHGHTTLAQSADQSSVAPAPKVNAKGTGEWMAGLFTMNEGRLLIAGKSLSDVRKARLSFDMPTEIQHNREKVIVNQGSLYPIEIGPTSRGSFRISIYTPMYDFLDDTLAPDGLPSYRPHPKDEAMSGTGFKTIATILHGHFTQITGHLPVHERGLDTLGYPSESYIWETSTELIIFSAYNGNDTDGIVLTITSNKEALKTTPKRPSTTLPVFSGWGDPLPHRGAKESSSGS